MRDTMRLLGGIGCFLLLPVMLAVSIPVILLEYWRERKTHKENP